MSQNTYNQGEKLDLDKPLTEEERKEIEIVMNDYSKNAFVHRAFLRLLCAEKIANENLEKIEKEWRNGSGIDLEETLENLFK